MAEIICIGRNRLAAFYNNTGVNYYENGAYEKAVIYFKKSLKIAPGAAIVHFSLANAYKENNQENNAAEEYEKCLQLNPANDSAYKSLAKIYLKKQLYPNAITQPRKFTLRLWLRKSHLPKVNFLEKRLKIA